MRAETYAERRDQYWALIRRLEPGVTQIIVHLAGNDPEIRQVTEGWEARYDEFRIFTDPETGRLLEQEGVKTIGHRELGVLWQVCTKGA